MMLGAADVEGLERDGKDDDTGGAGFELRGRRSGSTPIFSVEITLLDGSEEATAGCAQIALLLTGWLADDEDGIRIGCPFTSRISDCSVLTLAPSELWKPLEEGVAAISGSQQTPAIEEGAADSGK